MLRLGPRSSCKQGLKKLDILTVPCLYIYALMLFAVKNLNIYQTNYSVHGMNTKQQSNLHKSSVRLSSMHRGVYNSSIKVFNQLPQNIFKFCNYIHTFKTLLRGYLVKNAFYSIDEFLSAAYNDADIQTFISDLFHCVVMHMVALNCCVFCYLFFAIYHVLISLL